MALDFPSVSGQLPNAKTTLFQPAVGRKAIVRLIVLTNVSGAPVTVDLWLKLAVDGVSRHIGNPAQALAIAANTSEPRAGGFFAMKHGDLLEGQCSAAASVDYVVTVIDMPA